MHKELGKDATYLYYFIPAYEKETFRTLVVPLMLMPVCSLPAFVHGEPFGFWLCVLGTIDLLCHW